MFIFYSRHQITLSFSLSDLNNLFFFVEYSPIPTEDTVTHFNELRQDIVLLYELKIALATCDYELESLKHRFETLAPGKVCYFKMKIREEICQCNSCNIKDQRELFHQHAQCSITLSDVGNFVFRC